VTLCSRINIKPRKQKEHTASKVRLQYLLLLVLLRHDDRARTAVNAYWTVRSHLPDDIVLIHGYGKLKSHTINLINRFFLFEKLLSVLRYLLLWRNLELHLQLSSAVLTVATSA
jgi:hypothetical protein